MAIPILNPQLEMIRENTSAPASILRARTNGAIAHGSHRDTALGLIRRMIFALGTVFYAALLLPFLVVAGLLLAFDQEKQDRINHEHGDGTP